MGDLFDAASMYDDDYLYFFAAPAGLSEMAVHGPVVPGAGVPGEAAADLAWRLLDRGYRLEYDASARMCHHTLPNARHSTFRRQDGRNRVLLARRNLPWPLAAVYLADWMALTVARERGRRDRLRPWFAGFAEGWRTNPGPRHPISLRTAWRMAKAGRPPVI